MFLCDSSCWMFLSSRRKTVCGGQGSDEGGWGGRRCLCFYWSRTSLLNHRSGNGLTEPLATLASHPALSLDGGWWLLAGGGPLGGCGADALGVAQLKSVHAVYAAKQWTNLCSIIPETATFPNPSICNRCVCSEYFGGIKTFIVWIIWIQLPHTGD